MQLVFVAVAAAVCSANALAPDAGVQVEMEAILARLLNSNSKVSPDSKFVVADNAVQQQSAVLNQTAARELQSCSLYSDCVNCAYQSNCKWCSWSSSSGTCQSTGTTCSAGYTSILFPSSCPSSGGSSVGCSGYTSCSQCNAQSSSCVWCQYDYGSTGFCRQTSASYCSGSYTSTYTCPSSSGGSSSSTSGGSSSSGSIGFNGASISGVTTAAKPPAVAAGGTFAIALIFTLAIVGVTTWQVALAMAAGAAAKAAAGNAQPSVMMMNPLARSGSSSAVVVSSGGAAGTVVGFRTLGWTGFKSSSATNITVRRLIYTAAAALAFLNVIYFLVGSLSVWYTADIASFGAYYLSLHTATVCAVVGGTTSE